MVLGRVMTGVSFLEGLRDFVGAVGPLGCCGFVGYRFPSGLLGDFKGDRSEIGVKYK